MDRDELAALLDADEEACAMARSALAAGADLYGPYGGVPATSLAGTYRGRMKTSAEKGIPTVGLAEAVSTLEAAGASIVATGWIGGPSDTWNFVVFIDNESGRLLACTAVKLLLSK